MLGTRVVFGLLMVAGLVLALWVDEWFVRPWYPFWLLDLRRGDDRRFARAGEPAFATTTLRPSANSVFGGVLAILIANWVPHLALDVANQ